MRRERQPSIYDPYEHYGQVVEELKSALVPSTEFAELLSLVQRFIYDPHWEKFPHDVKSELEIDLVGINGLIHLLADDVRTYHQKLRLSNEDVKLTYSLANYHQLMNHVQDFVATVRFTFQCGRYVTSSEREEMKRIRKQRSLQNS